MLIFISSFANGFDHRGYRDSGIWRSQYLDLKNSGRNEKKFELVYFSISLKFDGRYHPHLLI